MVLRRMNTAINSDVPSRIAAPTPAPRRSRRAQADYDLASGGGLQGEGDGGSITGQDVAFRIHVERGGRAREAIHPDHIRTHVSEQHRGEGAGTDAGNFDDSSTRERSRCVSH